MKKNLFYTLLICSLVAIICVTTHAQSRTSKEKRNRYRFNAGVTVGSNFSQIDGDLFSGFNNQGIQAGIKSMYYLNDKFDIVINVRFTQKGSRFELVKGRRLNPETDRYINLDYVELPIFISYKLLNQYGRGLRVNLGGSFARLFNSDVRETILPFNEGVEYGSFQNEFNKNEFNAIGELHFFFTKRLGIGFQASYQLNRLYVNPNYSYDPSLWITTFRDVEFLRNYQIGVVVTYHLD